MTTDDWHANSHNFIQGQRHLELHGAVKKAWVDNIIVKMNLSVS